MLERISWTPGIGDPSFMGWVTVFAYFLAATLCFVVVHHRSYCFARFEVRQHALWLTLGLLMAFLCINKQLDLQSLMTDLGRVLAKDQGWYARRRTAQMFFIYAVLAFACLGAVVLTLIYRRCFGSNALAILGVCILLAFIVIRASSFHHMDTLIGTQVVGVRMNWVLELSGIAMIIINAGWLLSKVRS